LPHSSGARNYGYPRSMAIHKCRMAASARRNTRFAANVDASAVYDFARYLPRGGDRHRLDGKLQLNLLTSLKGARFT